MEVPGQRLLDGCLRFCNRLLFDGDFSHAVQNDDGGIERREQPDLHTGESAFDEGYVVVRKNTAQGGKVNGVEQGTADGGGCLTIDHGA